MPREICTDQIDGGGAMIQSEDLWWLALLRLLPLPTLTRRRLPALVANIKGLFLRGPLRR
jgi:hypothetical protein